MTDDFAKLFAEIQKEGLFEPSYWRVAWRIIECCLLWAVGLSLISNSNIVLNMLGCVALAFGGSRAGWVMHEAGHHSLTGKPKWDRFICSVMIGIFSGLSAGWWNRGHNKHHAMPQRLHRDVDLDTMPFLAYSTKVVKNSKDGKSFFIQNQRWLFLSIDCFLGYCAWVFYICPRNSIKRRDFLDLTMIAIHMAISYHCLTPLQFIFTFWVGANYMFGNFALSHTHLPVTEEPTHWVEYSLTHTANVESNLLVDWWMGYLNFQIEHHLFPTLPQFRCYLIRDRVKALAKKYDLPYHEYSYFKAWKVTLDNFAEVAQHFKST